MRAQCAPTNMRGIPGPYRSRRAGRELSMLASVQSTDTLRRPNVDCRSCRQGEGGRRHATLDQAFYTAPQTRSAGQMRARGECGPCCTCQTASPASSASPCMFLEGARRPRWSRSMDPGSGGFVLAGWGIGGVVLTPVHACRGPALPNWRGK